MAARSNAIRHDENTRKKIQAAQIINRLAACVNGEVELSAVQVSAAKILLGKVLPDLASVQHSGDKDNPLHTIDRIEVVYVAANAAASH